MADHAEPKPISSARAWWAVFVLFIAYTFSYIDRSILSLLVGPVKRDLQLSDAEFGLLGGAAFGIFYCAVALPLAYLSDRKTRRGIIAWGVTVWSLATALCGFAQNFWHLFLARMGVGAGEAVLQPAAFSLIADLFPKEKRGLAYGIFGAGTPIGTGLALIVGGAVIKWFDHLGAIETFFGTLRSWQLVFIVVGLPGLLATALVMTIPEPRHHAKKVVPVAPLADYMAFLKKNRVMFGLFFVGFSCMGMMTVAYSYWMPALLIRNYGMNPLEAGAWLGVSNLIVGPIGGICAGEALRRFTKKGHLDAPLRMAMVGMIIGGAAKIFAPIMPDIQSLILVYCIGLFFSPWPYVAGASSLPLVTPGTMRAQIAALYSFVVSIIAIMGGPIFVGLLTDFFFKNESDVGKSMALLSVIGTTVMITFTILLFRRFRVAAQEQENRETLVAA